MADLNDMNKPDLTSLRATEVWQTVRGHIRRLWTWDYTGMNNLVAGMKRLVVLGNGDVKVVQRNAYNSEEEIFNSSLFAKSDGSNLAKASVKADTLAAGAALANIGNSAVQNANYAALSARSAKADQATNANYASQTDWTGVIGRPTDLAAFSNSPGYLKSIPAVTQTWRNVRPSRAGNATYTNSTGNKITVIIGIVSYSFSPTIFPHKIYVNGVELLTFYPYDQYKPKNVTFNVPPGASYSLFIDVSTVAAPSKSDAQAKTLYSWVELS